jgi:hypothetical protein
MACKNTVTSLCGMPQPKRSSAAQGGDRKSIICGPLYPRWDPKLTATRKFKSRNLLVHMLITGLDNASHSMISAAQSIRKPLRLLSDSES